MPCESTAVSAAKKDPVFLFLLTACFIFAAAVRIFVFTYADHLDQETVFRTTESYLHSPSPFYYLGNAGIVQGGTGEQRGYYLLNSLLMFFINQPVGLAKLTSLLFGILTIIPYYLTVKKAFAKEIAAAAACALSFYYIHIQLSTVAMANAGCIFFGILSLYFLMNYLYGRTGRDRNLDFTAAIIFTLLATAFRLEAWLLIIIYPVIIISVNKQFKTAGIFFIFSSLYIVNTLYLVYLHLGNPFAFLANPLFHINNRVPSASGFWARPFNLPDYARCQGMIWIDSLGYSLSPLITSLGFLGMLNTLKNKRQSIFLSLFWAFLIMLTLRQIISNHAPFIRYSSIAAIFFFPFVFKGAREAGAFFFNRLPVDTVYKKSLSLCVIGLTVLYFAAVSTRHLSQTITTMQYSPSVRSLTAWVTRNCRSGDFFFSSFNELDMHAAALANKYIVSNPYRDRRRFLSSLYDFLTGSDTAFDAGKQAPASAALVEKKLYPLFSGQKLFLYSINQRSAQPELKRLVFLLKPRDYAYIKKHFPSLFDRTDIKFNGFVYYGFLFAGKTTR